MRPSVAYWTSALFPEMEAIAGEVALLRRHFRRSVSWGVSSNRWLQLSWRRGFGVHPRMHLMFRAATAVLQTAFQVNHVFGGTGDWFHLKSVWKHPTVLTIALESSVWQRDLLNHIDHFAVEWPGARDRLVAMGIERSRIDLVYPPVDLSRFVPHPPPANPPMVLFASSPDHADRLEARGVHLLLQAAHRLPHVRFRLLWRPWGSAFESVQRSIEEQGLRNVELHREKVVDMSQEYGRCHVTIAPFTDMTRCKPIPNSLLESLASGVPVVVTDVVPLAEIVSEEKCGAVAAPTVDSVCQAIECALGNHDAFSSSARAASERWFGAERFLKEYDQLYTRVIMP
jgi:glycosyltransferase involved in cell wall biosynthesis